jgi:pantetheine-phosphate adenylyltransferase
MVQHVLVPGTFDPPTLGHVELVERAARLFPRVTVGVAEHPTKQCLFAASEREELLRSCLAHLPTVAVAGVEGLVVDACGKLGCDAILRGIRSGTDFDYERQMAVTNKALSAGLETVFLATSPQVSHLSSTLVRQVASMGGDVRGLVPRPVARALLERFARGAAAEIP